MAISQGGSQSNTQFTSSKHPGKESEPVLTAGEANDISMGVGQRVLDDETPPNTNPNALQFYRRFGMRVGTTRLMDKD